MFLAVFVTILTLIIISFTLYGFGLFLVHSALREGAQFTAATHGPDTIANYSPGGGKENITPNQWLLAELKSLKLVANVTTANCYYQNKTTEANRETRCETTLTMWTFGNIGPTSIGSINFNNILGKPITITGDPAIDLSGDNPNVQ